MFVGSASVTRSPLIKCEPTFSRLFLAFCFPPLNLAPFKCLTKETYNYNIVKSFYTNVLAMISDLTVLIKHGSMQQRRQRAAQAVAAAAGGRGGSCGSSGLCSGRLHGGGTCRVCQPRRQRWVWWLQRRRCD